MGELEIISLKCLMGLICVCALGFNYSCLTEVALTHATHQRARYTEKVHIHDFNSELEKQSKAEYIIREP